jgi:GH15 family glucan-1,4-alpha-glucosidase
MQGSSIIKEARKRALDVLYDCITPHGFRASSLTTGYPQIWARDSMIISLGATTSGDPDLLATIRSSLETMGTHQSSRGLIHLNVNPDSGYVSSENAGAADSNLWYILGHFLYQQASNDIDFLKSSWTQIKRAMIWLSYQDINECGLLEVPEAGNWMDLFAVRYNTLYDNVLYYAASLAYEEMPTKMTLKADVQNLIEPADIHQRINLLMWIERTWNTQKFAEHLEKLKSFHLEWFMLYHNMGTISSRPYYFPWVAFREYGDWCDSLGNLLAILTGVADYNRSEKILSYMRQVDMTMPFPTKAIHPPIYPGDTNWREYYRSRNLNLPDQYHNGGIWPMIGGFHIAALVKHGCNKQAESMLASLAEANLKGISEGLEFNEWIHGKSGQPMGYARQAWSASMFLYADYAVHSDNFPLFDAILAAKPKAARDSEVNEVMYSGGGGPV